MKKATKKPEGFETKKANGKGMDKYEYRIQISPLDCTGCGNCAQVCPARKKHLSWFPSKMNSTNKKITGNSLKKKLLPNKTKSR